MLASYATPYLLENYTPVPETGCWLWSGAWHRYGYGQVKKHGRSVTLAHRLFYAVYVGPIPDGMLVCHKCDTPACCNPAHLFLGTHQENSDDMTRKGRWRRPPRGPAPAAEEGEK